MLRHQPLRRRGPHLALPLVAACLGGAHRDAGAQAARSAVAPGDRVRVEAPALGPGRSTWDVSRFRRDTLLLLPAGVGRGPRTAVALADVTSLEVHRGRQRYPLAGAVTGLVAGAVAGAIFGAHTPAPGSGLECILGCTEEERRRALRPAPGFWALMGGLAGAEVGALVGVLVVRDRWQAVVPGRARLGVAPAAGGVGVARALGAR